uniref:Si:dkey-30j10.5 n=1 Tax=Nothobranchius kuhntae TaxID=321403 RepID=A0A1A8ITF5_NOTKU
MQKLEMAKYITDIDVSLNKDEETHLRKHGFLQIHTDLNSGADGAPIFLWYKTSDCPAITRIQFSFNHEMSKGLTTEGYHKIDKNLNNGNKGGPIYLWFFKGSTEYDIPIVELDFSAEAADDARKFQPLWERLACDLNRTAGGKWIYMWVKRQTQVYICDVTATTGFEADANLFRQGYVRVDEDTNRGAGGPFIFLWYRQTTNIQRAIKDLQISIDAESVESYENQYYEKVPTNLNQGTGGGVPVFLWFKKNECGKDPIKIVTLVLDHTAIQPYVRAGVEVIEKNLNTGNKGVEENLCYYF